MRKIIITAIATIVMLTSCTDGLTYKAHNEGFFPYLEFDYNDIAQTVGITIVDEVESVIIPPSINGYSSIYNGIIKESVKGPEHANNVEKALKSITIGYDFVDEDLIESIKAMSNVTNLTFADSVSNFDNWPTTNGSWKLESLTIGDGVSTIPYNSFSHCKDLTTVTLGDGVSTISSYSFWECTFLTNVTLGDGITKIEDWAFAGCRSLKEIVIPNSVKTIESNAFLYNEALTSLILGDRLETIGSLAFAGLFSLKEIVFPKNLKSIGDGSFVACRLLEEIVIPDSVEYIGRGAFNGCVGLKSISLPAGTYDLSLILDHIPGDWTLNGEKIEDLTNFVATDRKLLIRTNFT